MQKAVTRNKSTQKKCLGLCVFYGQNHYIIFLMNGHFMLCILHPSFTADYERLQLDVMIPSTFFFIIFKGKASHYDKKHFKIPHVPLFIRVSCHILLNIFKVQFYLGGIFYILLLATETFILLIKETQSSSKFII